MRIRFGIPFLVAGVLLAMAPLAIAGTGARDRGAAPSIGHEEHLEALLLDPAVNPDGEAPDERILAKAEIKFLLAERSTEPRANVPVFEGIVKIVDGWVNAVANHDDAVLGGGLDAYLQKSLRSLLEPFRLGSLEVPITTPIKSWISAEVARQVQAE